MRSMGSLAMLIMGLIACYTTRCLPTRLPSSSRLECGDAQGISLSRGGAAFYGGDRDVSRLRGGGVGTLAIQRPNLVDRHNRRVHLFGDVSCTLTHRLTSKPG